MDCIVCGKFFTAKRSDAKYCENCKSEARRASTNKYYYANQEQRKEDARKYAKTHTRQSNWQKVEPFETKCIYCGETFITIRKNKKSCGKTDEIHRVRGEKRTVEVKCESCSKMFQKCVSDVNKNVREHRKNYCNAKCMGEAYKDRIKLTCSECGETFERAKSGVVGTEKHYFCSKECQAKNIDYILRGEYHFRYIDGESKNNRGKGWIRIRKEVRLRDNYTCGICGITEKEIGKALDVHHIKPYRLFDDSEKANGINNLISLCPSCHHREEYKTALIEKEKIWQILNYQQK